MLKRMWAIVISVVMLVSLCPTTSVFAADGKPAAIVETFEDGVVDSSIVKLNNYTFTQNVSNGVLSITNIVNGSCLGFNHDYKATTEAVYLSYDIQFKTLPTTITENTAMIVAGATPSGGMATMRIKGATVDGETKLRFADHNGTNLLSNTAVEAGKWYKIIFAKNLTDAANSNIAIAAVLDEDGNLIGFNRRTGMGSAHTQYSIIRAASAFTGAEILIDNVKFSAYDRKTYGPSVMDYFVDTNADGYVKRTAKSMVVSFEEALKTTPTATITSGSNTINCTVAQLQSATTTMLYKITWTDDLTAETNYTLSISGSNEAGKTIVGTVEFSTAPLTLADSVIRDDFENTSLFTVDTAGTGYYSKDDPTVVPFVGIGVHGVFLANGYSGTNGAAEIKYNQANASGTYVNFRSSSPYVLDENKKIVVNYRMRINDAAAVKQADGTYTGGNYGRIGVKATEYGNPNVGDSVATIDLDDYTGEGYIGAYRSSYYAADNAGEKGFYYTPGVWYNATYTIGVNSLTFKLTDISTGELLFENSLTGKTYNSASGYYISLAALDTRANGENKEGAAVAIDDVALWQIDNSKDAHALTASANANDNAVTLTFNQPTMVTADMFTVSKDSEGNEPVEANIDVKYTDFDTNVVTISGIDCEESYYLDYSAVTSAGSAAIASGALATSLVQFTVSIPTTSVMGTASFAEGTIALNYWNMDGNDSATFIAAFYKGTTLVDVALLANKALSANRNSVSFAAADVPADADGMIVYAINSLGSLVPLCVPTAKVSIN